MRGVPLLEAISEPGPVDSVVDPLTRAFVLAALSANRFCLAAEGGMVCKRKKKFYEKGYRL